MTAINMQAKVNYAAFVLHKAGLPRRDVANIIGQKNGINKDNIVKKAEAGAILVDYFLAPKNLNFRHLKRVHPENIDNLSSELDIFQ